MNEIKLIEIDKCRIETCWKLDISDNYLWLGSKNVRYAVPYGLDEIQEAIDKLNEVIKKYSI